MSIVRIFHFALAGQDISGAMERARDSLQKYEESKFETFWFFDHYHHTDKYLISHEPLEGVIHTYFKLDKKTSINRPS